MRQYEPDGAPTRAHCTKTTLVPDAEIARDAARLDARLQRTIVEENVAHARGSTARPLTDAELFAKVRLLIEPRRGERAGHRLVDAVLAIEDAASLDAVIASALPAASATSAVAGSPRSCR